MVWNRSNRDSFWAAVVLAGITLFTFYTFRDYGPGSAVRRFHEDVLTNNLDDLQRVCSEPVSDLEVGRLASFLKTIEDTGAVPKLATMERSQDEVDVLVLYDLNGSSQPFVWVVTRKATGWQVNAVQTVRANPPIQNG